MVVSSQVPLISVRFIVVPDIAGVVKSEPCGLLHKMKTVEWSGLRSIVQGRDG